MHTCIVDRTEHAERLFTGYSGRLLILITIGSLGPSMVGQVIPPLLPAIIDDLLLTPSQAGIIMTVWWFAIAAHNYPGGRLADDLTNKTVLVAGLGLAIVGLGMLFTSKTYLSLLAGVIVVGAGRGLYQPAAISEISQSFVRRRGQALGIRGAAFQFGGVLAGGLAVLVLAIGSWRTVFIPLACMAVTVLVLMHLVNRDVYTVERVTFDFSQTGARLVSNKSLRWLVLALSTFGFVWNGTLSFLPAYLVTKGITISQASIGFAGVFLVGVLFQPAAGALGDRFNHSTIAMGSTLSCAIGMSLLIVSTDLVSIALALFVLAIGLSTFWPVMIAHCMSQLSRDTRAGDWGAMTAVFLTAEGIGSAYVGVAIEYAGYLFAFSSLLVCLLLPVGITMWLSRTERAAI